MPLYEIIPLEAVVATCCVLDLYTYCKGEEKKHKLTLELQKYFSNTATFKRALFPTGRPKGVKEQDVYICDYRLDKSAHLFYKIHRNRYPVCTKPYAFNHFPKRLAPKRDFSVRVMRVWTLFLFYKHKKKKFRLGGQITAQPNSLIVYVACSRSLDWSWINQKQMRKTTHAFYLRGNHHKLPAL